MTQEQKAKAYDKALERARAIINDYEERGLEEILFYAKEDLGCIFPELKESEDEKIRKHLIDCVTRTIPEADAFKEISKEQILAWLEKQGESYTKRDVDDAFVEGMALAKDELEKQVKPKEYTFKSLPRLLDMIEPSDRAKAYCQKLIGSLVREGYKTDAKIVAECLKKMNGEDVPMAVMDEKQGEQNLANSAKTCKKSQRMISAEAKEALYDKPAWSEEDEHRINRISDFIWKNRKGDTDEIYQQEQDVNWLNSIKNKVLPQSIACYNPYKEVVESIAEMCKHYDKASHSGLRDFYDNIKVKCRDVKEYDSLYQQDTWKPSNEQLYILNWVATNVLTDGIVDKKASEILYTLYDDLKKLKGE